MKRYVFYPARDRDHTIWEMLRWFESRAFVDQKVNEWLSATPLLPEMSDALDAVCQNVAQGREYFQAARGVTLATQPTLVYYGIRALARAVVLTASIRSRARPPDSHGHPVVHGLSPQTDDVDWRDEANAFTSITIRLNPETRGRFGEFHDLIRAVSGDEWRLGHGSDDVPRVHRRGADALANLQGAIRVPLTALANALPGVGTLAHEQLPPWSQGPIRIDFAVSDGPNYLARMVVPRDVQLSPDVERELQKAGFEPGGGTHYAMTRPFTKGDISQHLYPVLNPESGYYIHPGPYEMLFPRMGAIFAIAHLLSHLARYRPAQWLRLLSGQASAAVHVVRRFMQTVFQDFPLLALRELTDRYVDVGRTWKMG